jgi:hypothetical protein
MKKTISAVLLVLLFCSPGLAAAKKSEVSLPLGLNWKDNENAVRNKLTNQELREMKGPTQLGIPGLPVPDSQKKKKAEKETVYQGKVMGSDAVVNVQHRKYGIESVVITFFNDAFRGTGLPQEIHKLPETLRAELGEHYKGTDANVWSRVLPKRLVGNNVWYNPKSRHLVWMANISSYNAILTYAYVEKSPMFFYFLGGGIALAVALVLRRIFWRKDDYLGYGAGVDDEG